jgi:hypothetical protein
MIRTPAPPVRRRSGFKPTSPPPAPRGVRRRAGAAVGVWAIRLFILPHVCVGVFLILAMVFMPVWALAGKESTAAVTRAWTTRSKNSTTYRIAYVDPTDGRTTRDDSVSRKEFDRLSRLLPTRGTAETQAVEADPNDAPAATTTVRSLGVGAYTYRGVVEPGASGWGTVGFVWLFGLFWNGIVSVFFFAVYVGPFRDKRLHRHGESTLGRITGKTTRRGSKGGTRYVLKYAFTPSRRGITERTRDVGEATGEYTVERSQWEETAEGDEVWVLHWPGRAKPSALYGYGPYAAG